MNKTFIIIRREFLYRVRKRSFFLLTILMPILFATVFFVPFLLSSVSDDSRKTVVIIDRTGIYAPVFESDGSFLFVESDTMSSEFRDPEGETYAVVSIWDDLAKNSDAVRIYSVKEVVPELVKRVNSVLSEKIRAERIAAYGIPGLENILEQCCGDFHVQTIKWTAQGTEKTSDPEVAMAVGVFFTLLIYTFVLSYGGMVMQSVMEEKTSRVMEIMVSSVKPFTLMIGKITGVALVGLLQLAVWGVLLVIIISVVSVLTGGIPTGAADTMAGTAASLPDGFGSAGEIFAALSHIDFLEIIIMFMLCFIGGYLFYASFFAAMGSAVNSHEDSSQFMLPMVVVMIFAFYTGIYSADNPDGLLAFWCSMFPLTSPIVMMVRLPFGVPLWQELLSLALLFGSAAIMIWVAGRIYRVGVLMYGKKPSLREILRWVNYR